MDIGSISFISFLMCSVLSSFNSNCRTLASEQATCLGFDECFCTNEGVFACYRDELSGIPSTLPPNTTTVKLKYQNISKIYKADFVDSGYEGLLVLMIQNSKLRDIENGSFASLTSLIEFNLDGNELTSLDATNFHNLFNLKLLSLTSNAVEIIENGTFENLTKLVSLDLSRNKISTLYTGIFSGLVNLIFLSLKENEIYFIDRKTFQVVQNLRTLNLSFNRIRELDNFTFVGLDNLRYLSISDNVIDYVGDDTFQSLSNLSSLSLAQNRLTHLTFSITNDLRNLETLQLNDNQLTSIHNLSILPFLKKLDVSNNIQLSLPFCSLGELPILQSLFMSNTNVTFTLRLFIGTGCRDINIVPPLQHLYIQHSNTKRIDLDLTKALPYLQNLSFGDLDIEIENGSLSVLDNLKVLSLHNLPSSFYRLKFSNSLPSKMTTIVFYGLDNFPVEFLSHAGGERLLRLVIRNSNFEYLPANAFANLSSLENVEIHNGSLLSIDKDALNGLGNLTKLEMTRNRLSTLPEGLFQSTPYLGVLNIHENPWSCDCNLKWLIAYIELITIDNLTECVSPTEMSGKVISLLSESDFQCNDVSFSARLTSSSVTKVVTRIMPSTPMFPTNESTEETTNRTYTRFSTANYATQSTDATDKATAILTASTSAAVSTEDEQKSPDNSQLNLTFIFLGMSGIIVLILLISLGIVGYKYYQLSKKTRSTSQSCADTFSNASFNTREIDDTELYDNVNAKTEETSDPYIYNIPNQHCDVPRRYSLTAPRLKHHNNVPPTVREVRLQTFKSTSNDPNMESEGFSEKIYENQVFRKETSLC
ncbi:hypothetical protein BSL78_25274 [Apostichopus japonicus]|uniref:LRRCT domain-containing protein n=1 Tax=Stichopus japonicus TaxID=307972 RepID=A0A2G8JQ59_STIJA|nr:hypothetical protein BSL78_25274 [Apostichopus japonicus]